MKILKTFTILFLSGIILSSCATIFGGSKYHATVYIPEHPNAQIYHKGELKGDGHATFKAHRKEANNFALTIKETNCESQEIIFSERSFRGWALVGTILFWTGSVEGILIPWGVILDLGTGSLWKPDKNEPGVEKTDFNNYNYTIQYTGCETTSQAGPIIEEEKIEIEQKAIDPIEKKLDKEEEMVDDDMLNVNEPQ